MLCLQDSSRSFVTHWTNGKPEDVTLSCQVVGTDPTYGFPRVCDQTASIRVFQDGVVEAFVSFKHEPLITANYPESQDGRAAALAQRGLFVSTVLVR